MKCFLQILLEKPVRRIPLKELRRCWLLTHPEQIQHPERDSLLFAALQELEAQGALSLPAAGSFELGYPAMPKFVTLCRPLRCPSDKGRWADIAWHPDLGFWTELSQRELLTAALINQWLIRRQGQFLHVPLRERSLDIFGDEKYLDSRIRNGALFAGRLPLGAIGAFQAPLPIPYRVANALGQPVLVIENHHTYWSLAEWNLKACRFAAVAYGAGNSLCSASASLREVLRECRSTELWYFGDLDPAGVHIPLRFQDVSGVTLRPVLEFYIFLLKHGTRRAPVSASSEDAFAVKRWLPELAEDVLSLWETNQWVPQEALGTEQLAYLFGSENMKISFL